MLIRYGSSTQNNAFFRLLIIVGAISMLFGSAGYLFKPDASDYFSTFLGMCVGFGAALTGIGIFGLIRLKRLSPEKLKREEIERLDERNKQITLTARSIGASVASILLVVCAFLFMALGYRLPALLMVGALYAQVISILIAHRYFSKKM